jgi:vitamin B12 transporter
VKLRCLLIVLSLVVPFVCLAAADSGASAASTELTSSEETHSRSSEVVDDFLLFWEEKDLYVESPTRNVKPISQAAENMTVITAKEIEDMNAHTVAEVLDRVTGVFVDFSGHDFGSASLLHVQGSSERHVLVLLDGIPWNFLSSGTAETNSIPVRIIQRIEVIKGPASSVWGSSLGGVINIITKDIGNTYLPSGSINASYGQKETQDYSAEAAGKAGFLGYYLYAGRQDSDGLSDNRSFDNNSFYSKFIFHFPSDVRIGITAGYSEPHMGFIDIPSGDTMTKSRTRVFWATSVLDADLTNELSLDAELYEFKQRLAQSNNSLGLDSFPFGPAGELFLNADYDEQTTGGSAKLIWSHNIHTAVLGMDISHGSLDQTLDAGQFVQSQDVPARSAANPEIDKWAVFANDTVNLGTLSITPGIRYDHNSISGPFLSPSFGAAYKLSEHAILRASIARGFSMPPLSWTSGGALFLDPNPSLKPEKVWSYQLGVETSLLKYLWAKATLFYHDLRDTLVLQPMSFPANNLFINDGSARRRGIELEAETAPYHNISLKAGFAYVNSDSSSQTDGKNIYEYNLGIKYDERKSFTAQLFGHYVWWDLSTAAVAKYNDFLWDLDLRRRIYARERTSIELFASAHNIFNGSQYTFGDEKSPKRWAEAGLTVRF